MLKVGITGGIGSGKTTVCRLFGEQGVPIYYADDRAKWLMQNDEVLKASLEINFGEDIYQANGQLDRAKLAERVFNNPKELELLNSLVHPAVLDDGRAWMEQQAQAGHPYAIKEAALLFESGSHRALDKVIVVAAPESLRVQRVMQRDSATEEQVRARMDKQMPEAEKRRLADFTINNIDRNQLHIQVETLHKRLLQLSKGSL